MKSSLLVTCAIKHMLHFKRMCHTLGPCCSRVLGVLQKVTRLIKHQRVIVKAHVQGELGCAVDLYYGDIRQGQKVSVMDEGQ